MKTFKIILITVLFSGFINAQNKQGFDIETQGGYEYNYFKSPTQVRMDGVLFTETDLIASSLYQDVDADYDYRTKWDNHRLRFSVNPFARLFYDNLEDSYWSLLASAKYDYRISKTTKLLAQASFKRMNRKGLDGAQDVLINPLGYTNYGLEAGLEFVPLNNNETTVTGFYNFKNFDEFGIRDLQFNEFGVELKTAQEFEVNDLTHTYGITAYAKKRRYDTFNASDVIPDGERNWSYFKATAFYDYPVSKTIEFAPSFVYYVRTDKIERSGFKQFGPAVGLKFDNDKTYFRATFKYLTRNYTDFDARNNEGLTGEKIQYNYADFSLKAEHQITDAMFLTAQIYSRVRATNYTDIDARSFRGYRNQFAGIGIKWEL